ncbi:MAG: hypothetical protein NT029_10095 [Armatimonadetes bacterium]|nr:hypothetical protein [Armatimonadota bacterium]
MVVSGLPAQADGSLWVWGSNVGDGTTSSSRKPVHIASLGTVRSVASSYNHTLAVRSDGTVWAWGMNDHGQLGDGTSVYSAAPVQVVGLANATAVAAGFYHSLALRTDGSVWAWGDSRYNQLGDGTTTSRAVPGQVPDVAGITAVAGGGVHSLALSSDGAVWAWGANNNGQLGDGTTTSRTTPVQVAGLTDVTAIAGGSAHGLALRSDGTVWAWGYNGYGQLGDRTNTDRPTPFQVPDLAGVIAVASQGNASMALTSDGVLWAWGHGVAGELGNGALADRWFPLPVPGLTGVTAIAAGYIHGMALRSDDTVWAWGWTGARSGGYVQTTPAQVRGVTGVISLTGGYMSCLAIVAPIPTAIHAVDRTGTISTSLTAKAYLRRLSDNAWLTGRSITFAVDGVPIGTSTTDAYGLAACDWTIGPGPVTRAIQVAFPGELAYQASSASATLTALTATKAYVVDRTAKLKTYVVLKAYLFLTSNAPLTGKPLTVKLDGTVVGSANTNALGYVQFGYVVAAAAGAGTRTIMADSAGGAGYAASSATGTLSVTHGDLYLWPYIRTGKAGTNHALRAYVRSLPDYVIQPGKTIVFSVGGTEIGTAAVGADGWATSVWSIPADEPAGAHTAHAAFAGDAWYQAVSVNTTFNVVP